MLTEGELWVRAELERLRFTPAGFARFLVGVVAAERGDPARAAGARAAGVELDGGRRGRVRRSARRPRGSAVVGGERGDARLAPRDGRDRGRASRATSGPPTRSRSAAPGSCRWRWDAPAPLVCLAAAATDTLDGPAARRAGPTRAGRDLEGLVDACFAVAALRGARRRGWLAAGAGGGRARAAIRGGLRLCGRRVVRARGAAAARRSCTRRAGRRRCASPGW